MSTLEKKENRLKENWKVTLDVLENIVNDMNIHREKYKRFCTEYYWSGMKISNNSNAFRNTDAKLVGQLYEYSDAMMVYAEQISRLAQDILQDVYRIHCIDDSQMEHFSEQIMVIKNKMDIIQICNQKYTQELNLYVKYIEAVEKMLRQNLQISRFQRIKRFITRK